MTALTEMTGYAIDAATFACAVSGPATATITEQIVASRLRRNAGLAGGASPIAERA